MDKAEIEEIKELSSEQLRVVIMRLEALSASTATIGMDHTKAESLLSICRAEL